MLLDRPATPARAIRRDPVQAADHMFGFRPWSIQRDIIRSVWRNPRTAVRSGNGVGKTKVAFGAVGPLFLMAFPNSVVVTTAPTWRQVKELGWREWGNSWGVMRNLMARNAHVREVPIPQCLTTSVELSTQWHAFGMSTREPEAFAGVHAPYVLFIGDEASGIDEKIYEAGEGFLTGSRAHVLLIGNPTKPSGQFHRAFTTERAQWETLHISAFNSPNFTDEHLTMDPRACQALVGQEWVADKARRWGVDSPLYQVRVLGNFADESDDTIISLVAVENAQRRDYEAEGGDLLASPTVTVSCDVARFGNNETVLLRKRGNQVRTVRVYHGRDTMATAGFCLQAIREALREQAVLQVRLVVDDDGVGGGVTDRLRETMPQELTVAEFSRCDLVAYHGGEKAVRPDRFTNKRTESWFRAKWAMPDLDIPDDDDLAADLVSVTYKMTSSGQLQAERKEDVQKRLGRSPDRGDALVMLLEPPKRTAAVLDTAEHLDVPPEENAYGLEW
jgi:phage terminase large subunit